MLLIPSPLLGRFRTDEIANPALMEWLADQIARSWAGYIMDEIEIDRFDIRRMLSAREQAVQLLSDWLSADILLTQPLLVETPIEAGTCAEMH